MPQINSAADALAYLRRLISTGGCSMVFLNGVVDQGIAAEDARNDKIIDLANNARALLDGEALTANGRDYLRQMVDEFAPLPPPPTVEELAAAMRAYWDADVNCNSGATQRETFEKLKAMLARVPK